MSFIVFMINFIIDKLFDGSFLKIVLFVCTQKLAGNYILRPPSAGGEQNIPPI